MVVLVLFMRITQLYQQIRWKGCLFPIGWTWHTCWDQLRIGVWACLRTVTSVPPCSRICPQASTLLCDRRCFLESFEIEKCESFNSVFLFKDFFLIFTTKFHLNFRKNLSISMKCPLSFYKNFTESVDQFEWFCHHDNI